MEETIAEDTIHAWRLCPIGKHYVREHQEHLPRSAPHPTGETITRHAHCANNPLGKNKKEIRDILSFDELQMINKEHFTNIQDRHQAPIFYRYTLMQISLIQRFVGGFCIGTK